MKVSVIGAGKVGAESAFLLAQEPEIREVVLVDIVRELAKGEALDINYALGNKPRTLVTDGDYLSTKNSDLIVVCAGLPRKQGMKREDLLGKNSSILRTIISSTTRLSPSAFYLIVSNPVDLLTAKAVQFGLDRRKVAGVGTYHDTLRFRAALKKLGIDGPKSLVLGVHGDGTYIIRDKTGRENLTLAEKEVEEAGMNILELKKSTSYGIAISVRDTFRALKGGEIVSTAYLNGEYGLKDIATGVVCRFKNMALESVNEIELGEGKPHFLSTAKSMSCLLK